MRWQTIGVDYSREALRLRVLRSHPQFIKEMLMVIHRWRVPVIVFLLLGLFTTSWSLSAAAAGEASAGVPQLTLLKTIPIGGSDGWDYLCADSTARRLYLPRSTHVQVLDLDTGTVLGDIAITGTKNLHGVALALEQGLGFTTGGRDSNAVSVFDLKTFQVAKTIKAGRSPDSILYDPASKHILSINHDSGDVTVIDPAALDVAMSANGIDGTMSVVKETSTGSFEAVQTPKTIKGALTVTMDSKKHQALLPCNIPDGKGGATFGIAVVGAKEADKNVR